MEQQGHKATLIPLSMSTPFMLYFVFAIRWAIFRTPSLLSAAGVDIDRGIISDVRSSSRRPANQDFGASGESDKNVRKMLFANEVDW